MTCWEECLSLRLLAEALCGFHDYKMYRSSPLVKKMHMTGIACQAGSMVQEDLKSKPKNLFNTSTSAGHGDSTKTSPTFYPHHEDRDHSSSRSPPRRS